MEVQDEDGQLLVKSEDKDIITYSFFFLNQSRLKLELINMKNIQFSKAFKREEDNKFIMLNNIQMRVTIN